MDHKEHAIRNARIGLRQKSWHFSSATCQNKHICMKRVTLVGMRELYIHWHVPFGLVVFLYVSFQVTYSKFWCMSLVCLLILVLVNCLLCTNLSTLPDHMRSPLPFLMAFVFLQSLVFCCFLCTIDCMFVCLSFPFLVWMSLWCFSSLF